MAKITDEDEMDFALFPLTGAFMTETKRPDAQLMHRQPEGDNTSKRTAGEEGALETATKSPQIVPNGPEYLL
jgi:hypothetical protein